MTITEEKIVELQGNLNGLRVELNNYAAEKETIRAMSTKLIEDTTSEIDARANQTHPNIQNP